MAKAILDCSAGRAELEFTGSDCSLYEQVAKAIMHCTVPNTFTITLNGLDNQPKKMVIAREVGKFGKPWDKVLSVDPGFKECLRPKPLPYKVLMRIDAKTNAYDKHDLNPMTMGPHNVAFTEAWGRIGANKSDVGAIKLSSFQQDPAIFWIKYFELLQEGFQDYSKYIPERTLPMTLTERRMQQNQEKKKKGKEQGISEQDRAAYELYNILLGAAEDLVTETFDSSLLMQTAPFSEEQVKAARDIWNTLGTSRSLKVFNSRVQKLLALAPRRINAYYGQTVKSYLAQEKPTKDEQLAEYARIIDREDTIINAMEAILLSRQSGESQPTQAAHFNKYFPNAIVEDASVEEIAHLKDTMFNADSASQDLKKRITHVWKIRDAAQDKKLEAYCQSEGVKETKLLFHGSRTANWISIIKNSLLLNPNAPITGKAFGYGIYFANSADKSFGYTSNCHRWNSDNGDRGYMGVYETAYGKSISADKVKDYSQEWIRKHGGHCLHYHSGYDTDKYSFCRDEIVFYHEHAMAIRYLIEFT